MNYDVVVIGAGPGGMQAAIAAASEGLTTLVLEKDKPGGQIGQTPKLENSVFANGGITGPEFARMMREQCEAMGVRFLKGEAVALTLHSDGVKSVEIEYAGGGRTWSDAHTIVLALGNRWQELDIPGLRTALEMGVAHFGPLKSLGYDGKAGAVGVYGGGASAGQAILALADNPTVARVHSMMRSTLNMPQYLVDRIRDHKKIKLHENTLVHRVHPHTPHVAGVLLTGQGEGVHEVEVTGLFMCNGLKPATEWLTGTVEMDESGRVAVGGPGRESLETNLPGVYAIGDCRQGSTARVGVAIGDGSMVVTNVWRYFKANPVCRTCPTLLARRTTA